MNKKSLVKIVYLTLILFLGNVAVSLKVNADRGDWEPIRNKRGNDTKCSGWTYYKPKDIDQPSMRKFRGIHFTKCEDNKDLNHTTLVRDNGTKAHYWRYSKHSKFSGRSTDEEKKNLKDAFENYITPPASRNWPPLK